MAILGLSSSIMLLPQEELDGRWELRVQSDHIDNQQITFVVTG